MAEWLRNNVTPERRVKAAVWMFFLSLAAWPITSLTIFSKEPQGVLGLSWMAIILQAILLIVTTDVRNEQENGERDVG